MNSNYPTQKEDHSPEPKYSATRPDSLLTDLGMNLISEYCDEDVTYPASDFLPDSEWCPLWLLDVMPLP